MKSFSLAMWYVRLAWTVAILGGAALATAQDVHAALALDPAILDQKQGARQTSPQALWQKPELALRPGIEQAELIFPASSSPPTSSPLSSTQAPSVPMMRVALLLPLSGKNAALGQAMLNAAQQALFDTATANFQLLPRDTNGSGGADAAARSAVSDGAQLILGPLLASDVVAVKNVAGAAGIEVLAFSTDATLAERDVYVMGLTPAGQVDRVVAYAAHSGSKKFAALVPTTPYGALVGQAFQDAVVKHGGTLVAFETFDSAARDSIDHIKSLAVQKENIDALFLPESGDELKAISEQFAAAGLTATHPRLLGTGLWDVPRLGQVSTLLVGGWYAAPDPAPRRAFSASYATSYGQEPPRLATLAYDATALAAVLARRGARFDDAALTNANGFAGLDGIFRLLTNGSVERAMAVNEITVEQPRVVDAAPTSFVGK